ncbi:MAG TPA: hypothetical protein VGM37_14140 [Armatimonadota bacterium]|jgi:hypothetical protein
MPASWNPRNLLRRLLPAPLILYIVLLALAYALLGIAFGSRNAPGGRTATEIWLDAAAPWLAYALYVPVWRRIIKWKPAYAAMPDEGGMSDILYWAQLLFVLALLEKAIPHPIVRPICSVFVVQVARSSCRAWRRRWARGMARPIG